MRNKRGSCFFVLVGLNTISANYSTVTALAGWLLRVRTICLHKDFKDTVTLTSFIHSSHTSIHVVLYISFYGTNGVSPQGSVQIVKTLKFHINLWKKKKMSLSFQETQFRFSNGLNQWRIQTLASSIPELHLISGWSKRDACLLSV